MTWYIWPYLISEEEDLEVSRILTIESSSGIG
jgi:hypothetical protein